MTNQFEEQDRYMGIMGDLSDEEMKKRDKEISHEYYLKNKEKIKAYQESRKEQTKEYQRKYREEHKDQFKEQRKVIRKKYYETHKEEIKEICRVNNKKRYADKCEQIKTKNKKHYDENKEEIRKRWHERHPLIPIEKIVRSEEEKKKLKKNKLLMKRFGITLDDYNEMRFDQDGCCFICGRSEDEFHQLCLDHDHITGKIRKLLCNNCNSILGHARDDINVLYKAVAYLKLFG